MGLSTNFAEQQAKREKPSCFGKWNKCFKCGTCWFNPLCKVYKPTPKKVVTKKVEK